MPDKYERENDSAESTLFAVHETVGRIKALADELATYVDKLNTEMKGRKGNLDGEPDSRRPDLE